MYTQKESHKQTRYKLGRKKQQNVFQVGFFGGICLPCYELLAELLPGVQPMLDQVILDDYQ